MDNDTITVVNCSFYNNSASIGGAIRIANDTGIVVTNCILWQNSSAISQWSISPAVTWSDVQGGWAGEGNIDVDPRFVNASGGNLRLRAGSPCVDTGTAVGAPDTDILGAARPRGAGVDMGAYEVDATPPVITACAPNQMEQADAACEALMPDFTGQVVATDDVTPAGSLEITQLPAAGSAAALGDTPITITVMDQAGNAATCTAALTVALSVPDTTPPVITLNGDAAVTMDCGGTYTDPGATATDDCATGLVVTAGGDPVRSGAPGTYVVRYNVGDGNGNNAAEVTRTVTVVDITPPVITLLGSASSQVLLGAPYADAGVTASDSCADVLTDDVVVGGDTVNTAALGAYLVTYNVEDGNGNSAAQVTRTVHVVEFVAYRVNAQNTAGPWDGVTWATAFQDIQSAVDAAANSGGGDVWVAAGTYTSTSNPVVTLRSGASLYGEFAGTETAASQRDLLAHTAVIDGENTRRCVVGANQSALDGFTVARGNASDGGGMSNLSCSPTVTNCLFTGNGTSDYGGGMYNSSCSPTVTNCMFTGNTCNSFGGGMYNWSSSPKLTNCVFTGNASNNGGGALLNDNGSGPVLTNCTFLGNRARDTGGALYSLYSFPVLTNCVLWGDAPGEIAN